MSIRRIAEESGVSTWTVSLALRNSPKIPAAVRHRVQRVAKRIGYRPNAKVAELMGQLRLKRVPQRDSCFGLISLYDSARPWEESVHFERIHRGMVERAEHLGYRLEPFWLRAPGMPPRRLRGILDARGIQGLLCFGSPEVDAELPPELNGFAIVTQGLSINTPMHRVVHNVSHDMWLVLKKLHSLGYRRPGLVVGEYEGARSSHAYLSVYLGWSQVVLGTPAVIPVLQLTQVEEGSLVHWIERNRPDVIIFAHHYNTLPEFDRILRRHEIRVPDDIGVVAISQVLDGTDFSGMEANQHLLGAWAVELLISRIINSDFGIPSHPRIEMIDCQWVEGRSLRSQRS